jgi:uncharacterized protein YfaP (DUF2135 family)
MRTRFLLIMALSVVSALSALAEPPAQLDCTIHSWNEHSKKEKDHDYQHGYSTTKVAPKDIAWLRPGASPVGHSAKRALRPDLLCSVGVKRPTLPAAKNSRIF